MQKENPSMAGGIFGYTIIYNRKLRHSVVSHHERMGTFLFRSPNGEEKGERQIEDVFWEKGGFTG